MIPCRNESRRLPATLQAIQAFLDAGSLTVEVIIVVEKGTDNTEEIAQDAARGDARFRAICNPVGRGKGYAVKTGMLAAGGEIVFFMDADLSVPLRYVTEFLPYFGEGADVVFGSRRHRESVIPRNQPFFRVVSGRLFNHALRLTGATSFKDTQCGFKAFRHEAARKIFQKVELDGFAFDVEVLALAEVFGYKIVERPVEWTDAPGSTVNARSGASAFYDAVLAAWRVQRENR
ncbi:glycosyltransferase family 2 protein [soil metagenome]